MTEQSPVTSDAQEQLKNFWNKVMENIKVLKTNEFKTQELPLARIKKIMKMDEDVKMISAEAPVLFAKASEIFINELTLRGWIHAEDNKRRTLQRNDIAMAISKYDQFDFLIDIVPREEIRPVKKEDSTDQHIKYIVQLDQNQSSPLQMPGQIVPQQVQLIQGNNGLILTHPIIDQSSQPIVQAPQIFQVQSPIQGLAPQVGHPQQGMQVFTQVVGPNGEIQQVPIQLNQTQLQNIAVQMQGKQPGQPIIIQTSATSDQLTNNLCNQGNNNQQCTQFSTQVNL